MGTGYQPDRKKEHKKPFGTRRARAAKVSRNVQSTSVYRTVAKVDKLMKARKDASAVRKQARMDKKKAKKAKSKK